MSDFVPMHQYRGADAMSLDAFYGQGEARRSDFKSKAEAAQGDAVPFWSPVKWKGEAKPTQCEHGKGTQDRCTAAKAKGSPWCAGHRRSLVAKGLDPDAVTEWPR